MVFAFTSQILTLVRGLIAFLLAKLNKLKLYLGVIVLFLNVYKRFKVQLNQEIEDKRKSG